MPVTQLDLFASGDPSPAPTAPAAPDPHVVPPALGAPQLPPLRHEVIRSPRRRRTVQARLVDGVVQIRIPSSMTDREERHWVSRMVERFERSLRSGHLDLEGRAAQLADRYGLPHPASIRWVPDMRTRWASCSVGTGHIRIAEGVARFPAWVVDYLIVHELAHLVEPNHGRRFWELVGRYPRTERARGFLIAKGLDGG